MDQKTVLLDDIAVPVPAWARVATELLTRDREPSFPLLLWGPPATGKSFLAQNTGPGAADSIALTLHRSQPIEELRGMFTRTEAGTIVWKHGPVIQALTRGVRLVINELGEASEDCLSLCHAVLDRPESMRVTLPTGEEIRPAPGFHVVATSNTPPEELPAALQSRLRPIHAETPTPAIASGLPAGFQRLAYAAVLGGIGDARAWKAATEWLAGIDDDELRREILTSCFGTTADALLESLKNLDAISAKTDPRAVALLTGKKPRARRKDGGDDE